MNSYLPTHCSVSTLAVARAEFEFESRNEGRAIRVAQRVVTVVFEPTRADLLRNH